MGEGRAKRRGGEGSRLGGARLDEKCQRRDRGGPCASLAARADQRRVHPRAPCAPARSERRRRATYVGASRMPRARRGRSGPRRPAPRTGWMPPCMGRCPPRRAAHSCPPAAPSPPFPRCPPPPAAPSARRYYRHRHRRRGRCPHGLPIDPFPRRPWRCRGGSILSSNAAVATGRRDTHAFPKTATPCVCALRGGLAPLGGGGGGEVGSHQSKRKTYKTRNALNGAGQRRVDTNAFPACLLGEETNCTSNASNFRSIPVATRAPCTLRARVVPKRVHRPHVLKCNWCICSTTLCILARCTVVIAVENDMQALRRYCQGRAGV